MTNTANKLNFEEIDQVSGGTIEDIEEIRSILLKKYPDIPDIGTDPHGAYDYIEFVLRIEFDIDVWILRDGPNVFNRIGRSLRKTPMTYDEVVKYLSDNI